MSDEAPLSHNYFDIVDTKKREKVFVFWNNESLKIKVGLETRCINSRKWIFQNKAIF